MAIYTLSKLNESRMFDHYQEQIVSLLKKTQLTEADQEYLAKELILTHNNSVYEISNIIENYPTGFSKRRIDTLATRIKQLLQ